LVGNAPADELVTLAADLDADTLDVISLLRDREWQQPDAAFLARLESDLRRDLARTGPAAQPAGVARSPASTFPSPSAPWSSAGRPRWGMASLLTALLVAFTLLIALIVIQPRREGPIVVPEVPPVSTPATPAREATPEASPTNVPFWLLTPPPAMGAEAIWHVDGPASTGTGGSSSLALDPLGNAWVLDGANSQFQIFSPDGEPMGTWGAPGSGEGEFDFQRNSGEVVGGIAFTPLHADDDFYVADSQNARIQQFDADRNFVRAWGTRGTGEGQFLEPVSVMVTYEGEVYVADVQRNDVQVFTRDGEYKRTFGSKGSDDDQFDQPAAVIMDAHSFPVVADPGNHRALLLFCCDPNRDDYVETYGGEGFGTAPLSWPRGIASDKQRRLYVADRDLTQIPIYLDDGRFINAIDGGAAGGTAFVSPQGVAIDAQSNLFVLDDTGQTVTLQKFRLVFP
jgi:sugar lactone lactonase YvrE